MIQISSYTDRHAWDELVRGAGGHPLQLWGWGEVKLAHGWQADRLAVTDGSTVIGGAQVLIRRLPKPFGPMVYVPRGPWGEVSEAARRALVETIRRSYHPLVITAEPDTVGSLRWKGWRRSTNRILLARTAVVDLAKSDEELLAGMSKKTRQYIRKSAGEGIVVKKASSIKDIDSCLEIYTQTARRAGFALHEPQYYYDIFEQLLEDSPVYIAEHAGKAVAFLWPVVTPSVAFELYGGMNDTGQNLRANYHLKWQVIQAMKARGVARYDVNGLLNDGVSAFKKGFIPDETMMSGTYDYPMSPLYMLWSKGLPVVKRIVQLLKK